MCVEKSHVPPRLIAVAFDALVRDGDEGAVDESDAGVFEPASEEAYLRLAADRQGKFEVTTIRLH